MHERLLIILTLTLCTATCLSAKAELQNIEVGGSLRIYGTYYTSGWDSRGIERIPSASLYPRPIGAFGTFSSMSTDKGMDNSYSFIEQRTALHAKAELTGNVNAYIELDSIDNWGEDFRSNYVTGADSRFNWTTNTGSVDDVEVYQAYIEANEMFGQPLRLRVGRQELIFGSEWLVGNNSIWDPFTYLSFDALRVTYETEQFSVDAFASKLQENGIAEEDGDVDFYGVYATYKGIENLTVDAYYFLVRDAQRLTDTPPVWTQATFVDELWREGWEDVFSRDDYDVTNLNTVGLRLAGTISAFDYEAEGAYQFGDASSVGALFAPITYGDDDAQFDAWGAHATLGYTFDVMWSPRVYIGGEYYGGEDNRTVRPFQRLRMFSRGESSVSFNRLFSSWEDDWYLDGGALSNAWIAKTGVSVNPTEALTVELDVLYMEAVDAFDPPVSVKLPRPLVRATGRAYAPVARNLPFWTEEGEDELCTEVTLWGTYAFSEDLTIEAGWAHLFTGEAFEHGAYSNANGLQLFAGTATDDSDVFYVGTTLEF